MNAPPMTGPSAIGTRRTNECSDTPIVRFSFGNTRATNPIVAGNEIAVHDRKNTAPTKTAGHFGTRITIRKPSIDSALNHSRARFVPKRSER